MKVKVELSDHLQPQEADQLRALLNFNNNSAAVTHLNDLHRFLLSGQVHDAGKNILEIEIAELTNDIVRTEAFNA
ncbi:hypothetical protein [Bacillus sp. FJAT-26390]|uniref:hypothetical protein n=1 Tax=Bacillus sp. FJAT-26390 TaxID=1743142 RepID=UPI000807DDDD|nr:hypothetical protein [Bacillus sp. FJAT-26390]OBZ13318.1 hypothetical protein A7975_10700 [Bacillus sp. FJAT-26390]